MSARIKAVGVIALVFTWIACFAVGLSTPNDSVINWVAFFIFMAPLVVGIVFIVGFLVKDGYSELVKHFEGKQR